MSACARYLDDRVHKRLDLSLGMSTMCSEQMYMGDASARGLAPRGQSHARCTWASKESRHTKDAKSLERGIAPLKFKVYN